MELVDVGALDRATYVGGGDIAAVMGVNPWKTPLDVYLRLTGTPEPPPDPEQQKRWRRGKLMEPVVLQMLRDDYGIEVVAANHRYRDPEHEFFAAEIDFEWRDADPRVRNGEIKTVHPFAAGKWGEAGTEDVPIEYAAQSMWGLMITGREVCQYGVLFGSDNLALYHVYRDDETIAHMRETALSFWHNHVLARVPPPPMTAADLKRLWPREQRETIIATPEIVDVLQQHQALGAEIKLLTEQRDELAFQIGAFVQDAATVIVMPDGTKLATYKAQSRESLDGKALKAAHRDIYDQFARSTEFRVLRHSTLKG